jgi:hypothetical protein
MSEKIIIRVVVSSEAKLAEEIETRIGLSADRVWRKGEFRPKTIIREKTSGWIIENEFPVSTEIEEAVCVTLRRLDPLGEKLHELGSEFRKELSVVIYCSRMPAMALSSAVTKMLGANDLGLDFDFFISPESAAEA